MKPVLQALLLADRIYQDQGTGKKIIAGTFNRLFFKTQSEEEKRAAVAGEPVAVAGGMNAGSPYAFVSLTEVRGVVRCELRYVNLEEDECLLHCEFSISSNDPLKTVELVLPMPPLPIKKAGIHSLELLCDGEQIGSLRIHVEEMPNDS